MIKRAFLFILVFSLFFIFYSYNVEAGEDITSWGDHNYTGDGGSVPDAAGDPMDAFTELKNPLAGSDGEVTFEVIVRRVVQATLGLTGVLARGYRHDSKGQDHDDLGGFGYCDNF